MEYKILQAGISTASFFNKCMLEDTPKKIANMNVGIIEVFFNTFSEYKQEFVSNLNKRVIDNGLSVYSVHPMGTQFEPQLFSIHERQRSDAEDIFKSALNAANILGAKYYIMHGPANLGGAVRNMNLSRVGAIARRLCDIAGAEGIDISWENVSWCLYNYPEFANELFASANADNLTFTLDTKQAMRSGFTPMEYLLALDRNLVNIHLCDYRLMPGGLAVPQCMGKGDCDFEAIKTHLDSIGYSGPVMLELYSDLYDNDYQLLESYEYIKKIFN